ncbi:MULTISPECIES: hypothetical protein [unclassified Microbacterium]|uniref:hypothetical protein n=1 Tax=unclassified Microbacterium TaxID=2609290 RepID=UPI003745215A
MTGLESDRLSPADVDVLRTTGVFRVFVPEQFGGRQDRVDEIARRIAQVSAWNADAGWLAAIAAVTNLAVAQFPESALDEIWGGDAETLVAGTLAPSGTLILTAETATVTAVSAPVSGLRFASWVMATVADTDSRQLNRVLVPVGEVRGESSWKAIGLTGAGGDTAYLDAVTVPARRVLALSAPSTEAPLTFFATLFFASSVVGMARSASSFVSAEIERNASSSSRWSRPDVQLATSDALRRIDRAEALLSAATSGLSTRAKVDTMTVRARSRAADLAARAVGEAESAIPRLIGSLGPTALAPDHPLALAHENITTAARHTSLSASKAALAYQAALFPAEPCTK